MEESETAPETFDAKRGVGILSGQPPSPVAFGPGRRAPAFYAGETYGRHVVQYSDVQRYPNGALPSKRNKLARRLIRGALKRRFSKTERGLGLPRAMKMQALEIADDVYTPRPGTRAAAFETLEDKPGVKFKCNSAVNKRARKLFKLELNIHQPVKTLSGKELRALRTEHRKQMRKNGGKDAIAQLVERMAGGKK